jgi:hypothetical protein
MLFCVYVCFFGFSNPARLIDIYGVLRHKLFCSGLKLRGLFYFVIQAINLMDFFTRKSLINRRDTKTNSAFKYGRL